MQYATLVDPNTMATHDMNGNCSLTRRKFQITQNQKRTENKKSVGRWTILQSLDWKTCLQKDHPRYPKPWHIGSTKSLCYLHYTVAQAIRVAAAIVCLSSLEGLSAHIYPRRSTAQLGLNKPVLESHVWLAASYRTSGLPLSGQNR